MVPGFLKIHKAALLKFTAMRITTKLKLRASYQDNWHIVHWIDGNEIVIYKQGKGPIWLNKEETDITIEKLWLTKNI